MKRPEPNYNPVIGYTLLDKNYRLICPHGQSFDPVFHSKERALQAAEEYGRKKDVFKVGEIYLEGTFGVVLYDVGDLMFDGPTAQRFFEACKRRGIVPNRKYAKKIDSSELETKYSCRKLLGDITYNRKIALSQQGQDYDEELYDFWGTFEGECQGCDNFLPLNDLGLCDECAAKLDRDLIRKRDWDYSAAAFGLSDQEREELRHHVIKEFGESFELISPRKSKKKKRKRKRK